MPDVILLNDKTPTVLIFHSLSSNIVPGTRYTTPGCNTARECSSEPTCHTTISIPMSFHESWVRWEDFSLANLCIFISALHQPAKLWTRLRIRDPLSTEDACVCGTGSSLWVCMAFISRCLVLVNVMQTRRGEPVPWTQARPAHLLQDSAGSLG